MSFRRFLGNIKIHQIKNRMESGEFLFPNALKNPKHILVCLPGGLRELTLVKQFLPTISEMFESAEIFLLSMPGIKVNDIFPRKGFKILSPSAEHLTWTGLAKKSYIQMLKELNFDMVLDLNFKPSNFTSYILLNFPDAIRIGRGNHRGNPFYNLEIRTKYLRDERNIYRSLLETLSNIKEHVK